MDDYTLIEFLLNCPAFCNTVNVSDKFITATFSGDHDTRFDNYYKELEGTRRNYDIIGHQLHFHRPGQITVKHFITVKPEKRSFLSRIVKMRLSIR